MTRSCQIRIREMSTSEPLMRCRNEKGDVKTDVSSSTSGLVQGIPVYCLNGVRHIGGMKLIQALVWNVGNCRPDAKEEIQMVAP
jgi:hypothetical protein